MVTNEKTKVKNVFIGSAQEFHPLGSKGQNG
jgi:hypothetical protein